MTDEERAADAVREGMRHLRRLERSTRRLFLALTLREAAGTDPDPRQIEAERAAVATGKRLARTSHTWLTGERPDHQPGRSKDDDRAATDVARTCAENITRWADDIERQNPGAGPPRSH